MDKNTLEHIANAFHAAHRIANLYDSNINRSPGLNVSPSNVSMASETMKIICEYLPDTYKKPLSRAIEQSNLYSDTIKNMRKHLTESRGQKADINNLARTLGIIQPVLGNPHRATIGKILKIHEIINS